MIKQFNNVIGTINPAKFYIYDGLRFSNEFNKLNNTEKENVINFIYDMWIDIEYVYLDLIILVALDNIDNIINNDNFDFRTEVLNNEH